MTGGGTARSPGSGGAARPLNESAPHNFAGNFVSERRQPEPRPATSPNGTLRVPTRCELREETSAHDDHGEGHQDEGEIREHHALARSKPSKNHDRSANERTSDSCLDVAIERSLESRIILRSHRRRLPNLRRLRTSVLSGRGTPIHRSWAGSNGPGPSCPRITSPSSHGGRALERNGSAASTERAVARWATELRPRWCCLRREAWAPSCRIHLTIRTYVRYHVRHGGGLPRLLGRF